MAGVLHCELGFDFMSHVIRRNFAVRLKRISEALLACGYSTLDEQAKALGVSRSTAWTIVKTKHKCDRLHAKTIKRILENPETPPRVRAAVQHYLAESPAIRHRGRKIEART